MMQLVFEKGQRVADVLGVEFTTPFLFDATHSGLNEAAASLERQRVRRLDGGEEDAGDFALPTEGAGRELRGERNARFVVRNVTKRAFGRRRLGCQVFCGILRNSP